MSYYKSGLAQQHQGHYAAAISDYTQAITLNPRFAKAYKERGYCEDSLQPPAYTRAIADYSKAIALDPTYEDAYYNRGLDYLTLGNYQAAIADYSAALKINPKDGDAYYNRGVAYYDSGRAAAAIADFSASLQIEPHNVKAYELRGEMYGNLDEYQKTVADESAAITLDPHDAYAYGERGWARSSLGAYQQALSDLKTAFQLVNVTHVPVVPSFVVFLWNMQGHVYGQLQQWSMALSDFTRAISLDPHSAESYHNRAVAELHLGQFQASLNDGSTAIKLAPQDAAAYADRSGAKLQLKMYQGAIDDATTALGLQPSSSVAAVAYDNRGQAEYHVGRTAAALADENRAVALDPRNAESWYHRGLIRAGAGDKQGAIADVRHALTLFEAQGDQDGLLRAEKELIILQG